MRDFQISRYLKKWLPLIIIFLVAMTAVSWRLLSVFHKYTASAVIEYLNPGASTGYAPDSTKLDLTEIYSSANMAKVMDNLELDSTVYSLDKLCESITVEAVENEQSAAIQEAYNEAGEEYTEIPTEYIVSCTMGAPADEELVRRILNETLDVYFEQFSEKHINTGELHNSTSGIADTDYDYLEMTEMIDGSINDAIETLDIMYNVSPTFRSSETGYSFQDIANEFRLLGNINISRLYAEILGGKITKDQEVLIAKYNNRIAQYGLTMQKAEEDIAEVKAIIDAYVQKMRESGNTDMDYNYILNEVYDNYFTDDGGRNFVDQYVEYDTLLANLVGYNDTWDYATVDIAYCEYIIDVFQDMSGEEIMSGLNEENVDDPSEGTYVNDQESAEAAALEIPEGADPTEAQFVTEPVASELEIAAVRELDSTDAASAEQIKSQIATVTMEMDELYALAEASNREFNAYLGAQNIDILSSTECHENYSIKLIGAALVVIFILIGCTLAVVVGRFEDIITYMFLTDKNTGCRNRVSCDRFIQSHEKLVLPSSFCAVSLMLNRQRELNMKLGRDHVDAILKHMGNVLSNIYGDKTDSFIGYNGGGQFWVFYELGRDEQPQSSLHDLVAYLRSGTGDSGYNFSAGYAYAEGEGTNKLRSLISRAAENSKSYDTI